MKKTEFEKSVNIIKTLQDAGHEAFIVGGWVRDKILGIESDDVDDVDVVTSALTHQIKEIFPSGKTGLGTSFLVNIVDGIELATYRYDMEDGYPLFAECFIEDSQRRDLTINSIGYDPIADKYIDFWNGIEDVKNKIIRFVDVAQARIEDDPVRMLRACRFAAKIEGRLIPSAFFAIKDNAHLINDVKPERIQKEILKAMSCKKPSIFFDLLQKTGILKIIMPELDDCWWFSGGNYHSEYVHEHLMSCGDHIVGNPILRLSGFMHDIGKVEAYDEYDFSFINHERFGADLARDVLVRLKFKTKDIQTICNLILLHMRSISPELTKKACRKTLVKLESKGILCSDFLRLGIADRYANQRRDDYSGEEINQIIDNFENAFDTGEEAFSIKDLKINGNDVINIGISPGPGIKKVLNYYFEHILEDPARNERESLLYRLNRDDWRHLK